MVLTKVAIRTIRTIMATIIVEVVVAVDGFPADVVHAKTMLREAVDETINTMDTIVTVLARDLIRKTRAEEMIDHLLVEEAGEDGGLWKR